MVWWDLQMAASRPDLKLSSAPLPLQLSSAQVCDWFYSDPGKPVCMLLWSSYLCADSSCCWAAIADHCPC